MAFASSPLLIPFSVADFVRGIAGSLRRGSHQQHPPVLKLTSSQVRWLFSSALLPASVFLLGFTELLAKIQRLMN